jgi:hypothetical protein
MSAISAGMICIENSLSRWKRYGMPQQVCIE